MACCCVKTQNHGLFLQLAVLKEELTKESGKKHHTVKIQGHQQLEGSDSPPPVIPAVSYWEATSQLLSSFFKLSLFLLFRYASFLFFPFSVPGPLLFLIQYSFYCILVILSLLSFSRFMISFLGCSSCVQRHPPAIFKYH